MKATHSFFFSTVRFCCELFKDPLIHGFRSICTKRSSPCNSMWQEHSGGCVVYTDTLTHLYQKDHFHESVRRCKAIQRNEVEDAMSGEVNRRLSSPVCWNCAGIWKSTCFCFPCIPNLEFLGLAFSGLVGYGREAWLRCLSPRAPGFNPWMPPLSCLSFPSSTALSDSSLPSVFSSLGLSNLTVCLSLG